MMEGKREGDTGGSEKNKGLYRREEIWFIIFTGESIEVGWLWRLLMRQLAKMSGQSGPLKQPAHLLRTICQYDKTLISFLVFTLPFYLFSQ